MECIICFTCFIVSTTGIYLDLQICEAQWEEHWNDEQKTAHAFRGDQWVSYDNIAAVRIKVRLIMCKS